MWLKTLVKPVESRLGRFGYIHECIQPKAHCEKQQIWPSKQQKDTKKETPNTSSSIQFDEFMPSPSQVKTPHGPTISDHGKKRLYWWFLNQPIWKRCAARQIGNHFPQKSGWKLHQISAVSPPSSIRCMIYHHYIPIELGSILSPVNNPSRKSKPNQNFIPQKVEFQHQAIGSEFVLHPGKHPTSFGSSLSSIADSNKTHH